MPRPLSPALDQRVDEILELLRQQRLVQIHALFDGPLKLALPLVLLQDGWQRTRARAGRLKRMEILPESKRFRGHEIVTVRLEFATQELYLTIGFRNDAVSGFKVRADL